MNEEIVTKITKEIINYENTNNLSYQQVFRSIYPKYLTLTDLEENELMVRFISKLTRFGYDIESTHPFKLSKFL